MKLNEIMKDKFFSEHVGEVEVRYYESAPFCEPPIHTTSINLLLLYEDWWGECNHCPENGQIIYNVEFNVLGKIYWMDNKMDFTFEELMEEFRYSYPQFKFIEE